MRLKRKTTRIPLFVFDPDTKQTKIIQNFNLFPILLLMEDLPLNIRLLYILLLRLFVCLN